MLPVRTCIMWTCGPHVRSGIQNGAVWAIWRGAAIPKGPPEANGGKIVAVPAPYRDISTASRHLIVRCQYERVFPKRRAIYGTFFLQLPALRSRTANFSTPLVEQSYPWHRLLRRTLISIFEVVENSTKSNTLRFRSWSGYEAYDPDSGAPGPPLLVFGYF